jgi:hypothetical protein
MAVLTDLKMPVQDALVKTSGAGLFYCFAAE